MKDQENLRRAIVITGYGAGAVLAVCTGAPLLLVPTGALLVGFAVRSLVTSLR